MELPNDNDSRKVVQNFLKVLDLKFSDESVQIDTTTSNPARICKVYGTLSSKGDHTEERPQRLNRIIYVPEEVICTEKALVERIANQFPTNDLDAGTKTPYESAGATNGYLIKEVGQWLEDKGVKVKAVGEWNGGRKFLLEQCVWDPSHTDNSAIIVQFPDGRIIAMCQHNSCQSKGFKEFRDIVEPDWRAQTKPNLDILDENEDISLMYGYPEPLQDYAFLGLAGDIVNAIEPHTEGDKAALLLNFLTMFGSIIGNNAHKLVEATKHPGILFVVLVGDSSIGRKGTSWGHIKRVFDMLDQDFVRNNVKSGISSGEGLVYHVRDPIYKYKESLEENGAITGEDILEDEGVKDKRLLVVESEFASILKVARREGNTVTEVIRQMWDNGTVQTLTKNNPVKATNAHVSIIGHITRHELTKNLRSSEMANGFANRFLFICTKRSKELPFGGNIEEVDFTSLLKRLQQAVDFGKKITEKVDFDESAKKIWAHVYGKLTSPKSVSPLLNNITSRMAPQVLRLALLYAVLDCSSKIKRPHLLAALSIAGYSRASCEYIFGNEINDELSEKIYSHIKKHAKKGLSTSQLYEVLGNNVGKDELKPALASLLEKGLIRFEKERKKITYYSVE